MCESYDIFRSTYQSATAMTCTFCDYGGGSMGNGIRKFAGEMINVGTQAGIKKGRLLGLREGYKLGFADGYTVGVVEGAIITAFALGVLELTAFGINKIKNKKSEKQEALNTEKTGKEEHNHVEVQSNI